MKTLALTLLAVALAAPCAAAPKPQTLSIPVASAKTFQVTEAVSQAGGKDAPGLLLPPSIIAYAVARPDKFRMELKQGQQTELTVSDGKALFLLVNNNYQKQDAAHSEWPYPLMGLLNLPGTVKAVPVPVTLNGKPCLLLSAPIAGQSVRRLWLDAKTHLPVRDSMTMTWKGKSYEVMRTDYSHWVLNAPLPPSTFQFTPPAGAKEVPK